MEKLRTNVLPTDDFQYITDFEAHAIGVKNYNDMILREVLQKAQESQQQLTYFYTDIVEKQKRKTQRAEQEKQRVEQEKQVLLTRQLHLIEKCLKRGDSLELIEDFLEIDRATLNAYIVQLKSLK